MLTSAQDQLPASLQALTVEVKSNEGSEALTHLTGLTALTLLEPRLTSLAYMEALAVSLTGLRRLQVEYRWEGGDVDIGTVQRCKSPLGTRQTV